MQSANTATARTAQQETDRDAAEDQAERTVIDRIVELRHSGQSYRPIAATLDAEELSPQRACHCG